MPVDSHHVGGERESVAERPREPRPVAEHDCWGGGPAGILPRGAGDGCVPEPVKAWFGVWGLGFRIWDFGV